jgi:hypothetical protein
MGPYGFNVMKIDHHMSLFSLSLSLSLSLIIIISAISVYHLVLGLTGKK